MAEKKPQDKAPEEKTRQEILDEVVEERRRGPDPGAVQHVRVPDAAEVQAAAEEAERQRAAQDKADAKKLAQEGPRG